ncbi:MAG: cyclic nucleotide-binding domain-containing protein, partial [Halobacteriales archaeon]|nr:cyclic nucleotide-binding domain-containing protein [Halobacteriales archaeon]
KARNDLHDHLKLADCYVGLKEVAKAVDEYVYVGDEYAHDGFYDRAIAVLGKAKRLNPMDDTLPAKLEKYTQAKKLEEKRTKAQQSFLEGLERDTEKRGTGVVEFQTIWSALSKERIVQELDEEQVALLFKGVQVVYLKRGEVLVERGARHDALYIVVSGVLSASIQDENDVDVTVRNFGPGHVVGDRALFQKSPWPATYHASDRGTVLRLDQEGLEVCLTGNPDPRGFLGVLRRQGNDAEVTQIVAKMES